MSRKLPERFLKSDGESFCSVCDKVRALCRMCDRCREHCECPESCEVCGGLTGPLAGAVADVQKLEVCGCIDCLICGEKTHRDYADYGYGLTEEQAFENSGTTATAVCEKCVAKGKTPPPASQRGFGTVEPHRCPECGGALGDWGCVTIGCNGGR